VGARATDLQSTTKSAASILARKEVTPASMMPEPEKPRLITSRFGDSRRLI